MRKMIGCALLAAALLPSEHASAAARPAVVELYTSEGCSSCPPADQLLESLARRDDVLALSFHVRYWDSLGWRDRFGLQAADERQSRYAQDLRLASVFTPQMIVDGARSYVGSDRGSILPALAAGRDGIGIAIERDTQRLRVALDAGPTPVAAEVLLLALLPQTETAIGAGENGGRRLREVNVVRASFVLGRWQGSASHYELARSVLPADAAQVAVLVQQEGQRAILGAAKADLR